MLDCKRGCLRKKISLRSRTIIFVDASGGDAHLSEPNVLMANQRPRRSASVPCQSPERKQRRLVRFITVDFNGVLGRVNGGGGLVQSFKQLALKRRGKHVMNASAGSKLRDFSKHKTKKRDTPSRVVASTVGWPFSCSFAANR